MEIQVKTGDVLDESADVLISTANPWLNMSGGVNGAILAREGEAIQRELHEYLKRHGKPTVEPGTVIRTGSGGLAVQFVFHAVAIDVFYDSSVELVELTITNALNLARQCGALTIAMPALATGYGHLAIEQFAEGLAKTVERHWHPLVRLTVVLRREENADIVRKVMEQK